MVIRLECDFFDVLKGLFFFFDTLFLCELKKGFFMSIDRVSVKLEELAEKQKAEELKLEQLKRRRVALEQKLKSEKSTEKRRAETRIKILLGAYAIAQLRRIPVRELEEQKAKILRFFELGNPANAGVVKEFFDGMGQNDDNK